MRSLLSVAAFGLFATASRAAPNNLGRSNAGKRDDKAACQALWENAPKNLANLNVLAAEYFPAGSTYNESVATLDGAGGSQPAVNLPGRLLFFCGTGQYSIYNHAAFCRFNANITTSSMSQVNLEVWLPTSEAWK